MRFIFNLALRTLLVYLFQIWGLVTLLKGGVPIHDFWDFVLFAFVGGILFVLVGIVALIVLFIPIVVASIATLGLFLIVAATVFNSIVLWAIAQLLPENVVLHGFWPTVLCGFLLSLPQMLSINSSSSRSSSSSRR
jgi:uncharacterized membrane protein YvlD (DUF360 family)